MRRGLSHRQRQIIGVDESDAAYSAEQPTLPSSDYRRRVLLRRRTRSSSKRRPLLKWLGEPPSMHCCFYEPEVQGGKVVGLSRGKSPYYYPALLNGFLFKGKRLRRQEITFVQARRNVGFGSSLWNRISHPCRLSRLARRGTGKRAARVIGRVFSLAVEGCWASLFWISAPEPFGSDAIGRASRHTPRHRQPRHAPGRVSGGKDTMS